VRASHKWTLGSVGALIPIIGAIYAFGVWSGVMWVTLDEFETFKQAQAQIDKYQNEDGDRRQRRHDIQDYKFYIQKMCEFGQELTIFETNDFDEIRERPGYQWRGC